MHIAIIPTLPLSLLQKIHLEATISTMSASNDEMLLRVLYTAVEIKDETGGDQETDRLVEPSLRGPRTSTVGC